LRDWRSDTPGKNLMLGNVLITGGAGFIGVRLANRLAAEGSKVVVLDNLHPQVHGPSASPPHFERGVLFRRGDVRNVQEIRSAFRDSQPDIVYHLAAETGTGQSFDEPARYCDVNVMGVAHLIETARAERGDRRLRIVLASSRAVYGEGAYRTKDGRLTSAPTRSVGAMRAGKFGHYDENGGELEPAPTPESLSASPASVYASTKLMQEHLLLQSGEDGAYETVVLRFQNVYGPGQSLRNPYTGVLSIFAAQILAGRRLNIFEDGEIVRDFVYVEDVVEALARAGAAAPAPQGPVNIGSGRAASIRHCAEILLAALGAPADRLDVTGQFRAGDIRHAVADIAKAEKTLGWRPTTSLEDGLSRLAAWAKESLDRQ
jgi:dTDP-L-rhamnose 4-epimerase